ncbi:hypothetical protein HDV03_003793 [Kappamyces sp. JEL0829]|nr:hypothetical protein HDV03_003793 [Kappamyces sp. JEL0829]KAJ3350088.1 hypothetical protein HDU91_006295 [Kappamyces sp. JEL0680]
MSVTSFNTSTCSVPAKVLVYTPGECSNQLLSCQQASNALYYTSNCFNSSLTSSLTTSFGAFPYLVVSYFNDVKCSNSSRSVAILADNSCSVSGSTSYRVTYSASTVVWNTFSDSTDCSGSSTPLSLSKKDVDLCTATGPQSYQISLGNFALSSANTNFSFLSLAFPIFIIHLLA